MKKYAFSNLYEFVYIFPAKREKSEEFAENKFIYDASFVAAHMLCFWKRLLSSSYRSAFLITKCFY